jgi:hypothetical protein
MQSLDEATNKEEDQEKLSQDYSSPFSPPSGVADDTPPDHPTKDIGLDEHEWYDEGGDGASGVHDQEER